MMSVVWWLCLAVAALVCAWPLARPFILHPSSFILRRQRPVFMFVYRDWATWQFWFWAYHDKADLRRDLMGKAARGELGCDAVARILEYAPGGEKSARGELNVHTEVEGREGLAKALRREGQ